MLRNVNIVFVINDHVFYLEIVGGWGSFCVI